MLNELQKATAKAVVNIFETGKPLGDYSRVTVVRGDPGHLTYGRSPTTLASGNLHLLVKAYCERPDGEFSQELAPWLDRLATRDLTLDDDLPLRSVLRQAGSDPVMREVQDGFFDRVYWEPAARSAANAGLKTPLGHTVVYDSTVHGSWLANRDRTIQRHGRAADIGEKAWIGKYVATRREWLAAHQNELLRKTVYRMDCFGEMIAGKQWDLPLPCVVRGFRLEESLLMLHAPRVSAEEGEPPRVLRLMLPYMVGEDVLEIQKALARRGLPVDPDGVYGPLTEALIRRFQQLEGMKADGIAGPATRAKLGLDADLPAAGPVARRKRG